MFQKVGKFLKRHARTVVTSAVVVGVGVAAAQSGSVTVDPGPITSDVSSQMTTIITSGATLLGIGIVASVGWRYAKRFLKG